MNTNTREQIKMGLLVVTAATVIYGTFFKDDSPSSTRRRGPQRSAAVSQPSTPSAASNTPSFELTPEAAQGTVQPTAAPVANPTSVSFAQNSYSFGTIKQNTQNTHVFEFTNSGDQPLIIENAVGSCGCTVPEYPKAPIAPGESGEIKVVYSPGTQKGNQTKTVTITANTEPRETRLTINALVEEVQ